MDLLLHISDVTIYIPATDFTPNEVDDVMARDLFGQEETTSTFNNTTFQKVPSMYNYPAQLTESKMKKFRILRGIYKYFYDTDAPRKTGDVWIL